MFVNYDIEDPSKVFSSVPLVLCSSDLDKTKGRAINLKLQLTVIRSVLKTSRDIRERSEVPTKYPDEPATFVHLQVGDRVRTQRVNITDLRETN